MPSLGMHSFSWREGWPVLVFPRQLVEPELVFAGLPDAIPRIMVKVERPDALAAADGPIFF